MGIILGLILVLAAIFRFPFLNYSPPELFGDEIDVGYQAYSLLKTGKDIYSQALPTYIHSLAEWRAPLLMYATVPTIAVFGLNEWGVRIPQAVFGSLAPLILAYLVYQKSKNKSLSLLSGFFLAILPWHLHYSRAAFEVALMLDLALLGTIFFLKRKILLPAVFFSLALYTYSTAIVFVPLLIISLIIFNRQLVRWQFFVVSMLLCAPLLFSIFFGTASQRFNSISVLTHKDVIDRIFTLRQQSSGVWGKLLYNRPAVIAGVVASNYLRAFSTDFLFVRGDPDYRQNLQIIGELLPLTAPLLLIGLVWLFAKQQWFWLTWLALAPIPASLTADGANHATRLFWMIPPLVVAMAAGLTTLTSILPGNYRKIGSTVVVLAILGQLLGVTYYYLHIYRLLSWRWWNVGYKNAMTQLALEAGNYDRVFINNSYEPSLERFLFWTKFPPSEFHRLFTTDVPIENIVPGYAGFKLGDKYYFGSFTGTDRTLQSRSLYLTSLRDDGAPGADVKVLYTSTNGLYEPILYLLSKP